MCVIFLAFCQKSSKYENTDAVFAPLFISSEFYSVSKF